MECLNVLIFLLGITTAYGVPIYKESKEQSDNLLQQEQLGEDIIRPIRQNQHYLPKQPEVTVGIVDLMNEPMARSKFPPAAGPAHNLLSELKKNIPLVPPLKLGLHKPVLGGSDKLKPSSECQSTQHSGLPLLASLPQLTLNYPPRVSPYSAMPEPNLKYITGDAPFPQLYPMPYSASHIPVSWETYITEEEKPHIHYASVPYINGYKLAPVFTEKKIELKDYVNHYGSNQHISPYLVSYPQVQHDKSDKTQVQTGRSAGEFIPPELQQPYGLDIIMQNQQSMARTGQRQPPNFSEQAYSDMIKMARQFFEQSQIVNPLYDFNIPPLQD